MSTEIETAQEIMRITPYNALGYGALIVALCAVILGLWKFYKYERNLVKESNAKLIEAHDSYTAKLEDIHASAITAINEVVIRLQQQEEMFNLMKEIDFHVKDIHKSLLK